MTRPAPRARRHRWVPVLSLLLAGGILAFAAWASLSPPVLLAGQSVPVSPVAAIASGADVVLLGDALTEAGAGRAGLDDLLADQTGWAVRREDVAGFGDGAAADSVRGRLLSLESDDAVAAVVIQAGTGDEWSAGADLRLRATRAIETARQRFPSATVLLVGPVIPSAAAVRQAGVVDIALSRAARATGAGYLSPLEEGWFGPAEAAAPPIVDLQDGRLDEADRETMSDAVVHALKGS